MTTSSSVPELFGEALRKIVRRKNLAEAESYELFEHILDGAANESIIAGLLVGLAVKGETFEELAGAAKALRNRAPKVAVPGSPVLDICGTGCDPVQTFNISTTAALVAAGAGCLVAKHGNAAIYGPCGSADVLGACGINLKADRVSVETCLAECGIGFLSTAMFHRSFQQTQGLRRELGIRTIFNLLSPLANPASADCMLVGVFAGELTEMFARALRMMGVVSATVVYGHDGMDEVTICAPTRITELRDGTIRTYNLRPELYFPEDPPATIDDLAGGSAEENARTLRGILDGSLHGPRRNIVLLNAAVALATAGKAADFREGINIARNAIDSGAAIAKLDALVACTNRSHDRAEPRS